MNRIKFLLPVILFIGIFIFFRAGLSKDPHWLPSMLVNKPLPSFMANVLGSREQISNKSLVGQVTLLNVWASWCSACQLEHPLLLDLMRDRHLQIYGLDYKDDSKKASNYLNQMGNPYQKIMLDPEGKIGMQLGVYGTPETFLIDKKGVIRYRYVGPLTLAMIEKDLMPRIQAIMQEN